MKYILNNYQNNVQIICQADLHYNLLFNWNFNLSIINIQIIHDKLNFNDIYKNTKTNNVFNIYIYNNILIAKL